MDKQLTLNQSIKEAVFEALLQMLSTKSLDEISISQLVKKAGICRATYYRNFDSKEDILIQYMNLIYEEFFKNSNYTYERKSNESAYNFIYHRLCFIKKHKNFFIILNKENILYSVLYQTDLTYLQHLFQYQQQDDILESYQVAIGVGTTTAIINEWITNGFKETEQELASMFIAIFGAIL